MNRISNETDSSLKIFPLFVIYYPLVLIIIGTILNLLTFIILCRTTFKNTTKRPTIHYMRVIAILDILILYGWNFDHFLEGTIGITLNTYSIITCKFFTFMNYFIYQISAWLRVLICFDRYLSFYHFYQTWFNISENILIIILFLFIIIFLINFHIFPFVCYYENNQIYIQSYYYKFYPIWNYINLIIYNCFPFLLMMIFNMKIIYQLILLRRINTFRKYSPIQHRSISIALLVITCLFFLMTIPASIAYAFFPNINKNILYILDSILYTYYVLTFPIYLLIFMEFRREFLKLFRNERSNRNIVHRVFIISNTSL